MPRHLVPLLAAPLVTAGSLTAHAQSPSTTSDAVFEGRTPCGAIAVEFTGFPSQNCEKIKWRLTLQRDPRSGAPTTYLYEGTRTTRRGTWRIARGTPSAPTAVVYHLGYDPGRTISFLPVDERILVLLDRDLRALPGDASWSYTLNRIERAR